MHKQSPRTEAVTNRICRNPRCSITRSGGIAETRRGEYCDVVSQITGGRLDLHTRVREQRYDSRLAYLIRFYAKAYPRGGEMRRFPPPPLPLLLRPRFHTLLASFVRSSKKSGRQKRTAGDEIRRNSSLRGLASVREQFRGSKRAGGESLAIARSFDPADSRRRRTCINPFATTGDYTRSA